MANDIGNYARHAQYWDWGDKVSHLKVAVNKKMP